METGRDEPVDNWPLSGLPEKKSFRARRLAPLQAKALLEAGERFRVTGGGNRVVPRFVNAPDRNIRPGFFHALGQSKEDF